jgi:hypothetical protein
MLQTAARSLQRLHAEGGVQPSLIRIRADLFYSSDGRQSPISRISAPKGVNLQLYLLTIFEAQCRKQTGYAGPSRLPIYGKGPEDLAWSEIVATEAKANLGAQSPITERGNRVRQIKSGFSRLHSENLVLYRRSKKTEHIIVPLHESGNSGVFEYSIPDRYPGWPSSQIFLPHEFFTRGWIHTLTPSEIRVYFALLHAGRRFTRQAREEGVFLATAVRETQYGISRDVYESHLMLHEIGLLRRLPDKNRHSDGKAVQYRENLMLGKNITPHRFRALPGNLRKLDPLIEIRTALQYRLDPRLY